MILSLRCLFAYLQGLLLSPSLSKWEGWANKQVVVALHQPPTNTRIDLLLVFLLFILWDWETRMAPLEQQQAAAMESLGAMHGLLLASEMSRHDIVLPPAPSSSSHSLPPSPSMRHHGYHHHRLSSGYHQNAILSKKSKKPEFLVKLYRMLQCEDPQVISWENGTYASFYSPCCVVWSSLTPCFSTSSSRYRSHSCPWPKGSWSRNST